MSGSGFPVDPEFRQGGRRPGIRAAGGLVGGERNLQAAVGLREEAGADLPFRLAGFHTGRQIFGFFFPRVIAAVFINPLDEGVLSHLRHAEEKLRVCQFLANRQEMLAFPDHLRPARLSGLRDRLDEECGEQASGRGIMAGSCVS